MSYWCVARSTQNHENLAVDTVTMAGFETFAPKTRVQVGAKWRTAPLFTTYFFARVEARWRPIERSLGVASVVKFGAAPAKVPDAEIAKLIARSDPDGVVRLAARPPPGAIRPALALGSKVMIADGPLVGFDGLYAGMGAGDRELVLMNILGAQRPVEIAAGLIVPSQ
jgi:transcription antitermination factor NusG